MLSRSTVVVPNAPVHMRLYLASESALVGYDLLANIRAGIKCIGVHSSTPLHWKATSTQ